MYRRLRNLAAIIVLGLAGSAVILEAGLRILGAHHPVLYQADPALGFRLKPNQQVTFFGNAISINDDGVRDARSFDTRLSDKTRVLVLGDSVTWGGVQLPQYELFTSVLEVELGDAEVINAGINGYSVWRMAELYRQHLRALKPDVIMLYVIPGDFYRPAIVDLVRDSPAFPLRQPTFALSSALASARIVLAARLNWNWMQPPNPAQPRVHLTDDERLRENIDALVRLNEELQANQRLLVVVSPFPEHPENPPLPPEVRQALGAAGIELLVLADESLRDPANFLDHIHLNKRGHALVGGRLAEHLRNSDTTGR